MLPPGQPQLSTCHPCKTINARALLHPLLSISMPLTMKPIRSHAVAQKKHKVADVPACRVKASTRELSTASACWGIRATSAVPEGFTSELAQWQSHALTFCVSTAHLHATQVGSWPAGHVCMCVSHKLRGCAGDYWQLCHLARRIMRPATYNALD